MVNITFNQFFALKDLLNGSDEDYAIAISNLNNLEFNDKKLVDRLLVKSLSLDKRKRFLIGSSLGINKNSKVLIGINLFNYIKKNSSKTIYVDILYEIMKV
ncbi:MAG: hypothetical protein ACI81I_000932 [Arcobacteraceae bacterium]|jgi:hypothetical protein|tara:strand:- start:793 stop:1095 length:303 start_codon:yes stop_codon:yes gene_type:complete